MSNNEDRNVLLNFLAGMGLGALVGAATALVLAPKSGKETRDDIRTAAEDLRTRADKVIHDLSESSEDLVKKSKEILEGTRSRMQQAIDAGRQAMSKQGEQAPAEDEDIVEG